MILLILCLSFSLFAGERELFNPEEKKILSILKSPEFLFEKMKNERRDDGFRFFSFILGVNTLEDKTELKRLDFFNFSLMEDRNLLRSIQEEFIEKMRHLEEEP